MADASKSKAEISAVNNLRKLYDALLSDAVGSDLPTHATVKSPHRQRPQSARSPASHAFRSTSDSSSNSRLERASGSIAVDAIRSLRRQQHQQRAPSTPCSAKSPPKSHYTRRHQPPLADAFAFVQWIDLATTIAALETDASDLQHEVRASELRCTELQQYARLSTDTSSLDPKLQCLEDALGARDFRRYLHSLYSEVAAFRRHLGLYRRRFEWLQQRIWETHDKRVSKQACLDILNRTVATTTSGQSSKSVGSNDSKVSDSDPVVLLSQYPVLFQHCLDVQDPDRVVLTELLALLSALPAGRETLLYHLFEQIADTRRGEGAKPPPDVVRPHKLMALAKQSLARGLCSKDEFDEIVTWLASPLEYESGEVSNVAGVSLRSFFAFHIHKSDAFGTEDAEFVTYLMRMWNFEVSHAHVKDGVGSRAVAANELLADDLSIAQVLQSYETRCQLAKSAMRKRELVTKIQHALANHMSKFQALGAQVAALQVLQLNRPCVWQYIHSDARLSAQCASSLMHLRVLVLSHQRLEAIPRFVASLLQLEVLDLSDNAITALPPEIAQLEGLHRLSLMDNRLTDTSFHGLDAMFARLAALCELQLGGNRLTTLPRAVTTLPSLTNLDMSANQLRTLPSAVIMQWEGRCQLVVLDLQRNTLTRMPEEIAVMRATLRCLLLHCNRLTMLPAALSRMPVLEHLTLSHNALGRDADCPEAPVPPALRHVTLDHNALRVFPSLALSGVKTYLEGTPNAKLASIFAGWNRLRSVPAHVFAGVLLPACAELDLQHNRLHELPDALFTALPALRVCRLNGNALTALPVSITACRQLRVLDVQQNRLASLPPELVQLELLVALYASDNCLTAVPNEWHAFASYCDDGGKCDEGEVGGANVSKHGRASASLRGGRRRLQTLSLRKNPIANRVLRTLVDGGSVEVSTAALATTKPSDEQICEGAIAKIIDALLYAVDVLVLEAEGVEIHDSNDDDDDERHPTTTRRWKGVTRNVLKYLERKLQTAAQRAMTAAAPQARDASQASHMRQLHVSAHAFRRLLVSLPSTCSEQELASLTAQFSVSSNNSSKAVTAAANDPQSQIQPQLQQQSNDGHSQSQSHMTVSGDAFLRAVSQFGQRRTLSRAPTAANSSFAMAKPGDPVASILHYLSVLHSQQQGLGQSRQALQRASPTKPTYKSSTRDFVQANRAAVETQVARLAARSSPTVQRPHDARLERSAPTPTPSQQQPQQSQQYKPQQQIDSQREVLVRRQQQRIAILEQQLVDQKLLQLSHQQPAARSRTSSQLMPASSLGGVDDDDENDDDGDSAIATSSPSHLMRPSKAPPPHLVTQHSSDSDARSSSSSRDGGTVAVRVQCAKGQEQLPAMRRWRTSGTLCFAVALDARICDVKQHIERETHIPVAHQVLLAPTGSGSGSGAGAGSGTGAIAVMRVRNDAAVREYLDVVSLASKMRCWCVTLLVGERLHAPATQSADAT